MFCHGCSFLKQNETIRLTEEAETAGVEVHHSNIVPTPRRQGTHHEHVRTATKDITDELFKQVQMELDGLYEEDDEEMDVAGALSMPALVVPNSLIQKIQTVTQGNRFFFVETNCGFTFFL